MSGMARDKAKRAMWSGKWPAEASHFEGQWHGRCVTNYPKLGALHICGYAQVLWFDADAFSCLDQRSAVSQFAALHIRSF